VFVVVVVAVVIKPSVLVEKIASVSASKMKLKLLMLFLVGTLVMVCNNSIEFEMVWSYKVKVLPLIKLNSIKNLYLWKLIQGEKNCEEHIPSWQQLLPKLELIGK
jgi:hypothetical protein